MTLRMTTLFLSLALLICGLAYLLGWLSPRRSWEEATGWRHLPEADRAGQDMDEEFTLAWLGHSGFLLRWHGVALLLDPHTGGRCTVSRRAMERPADLSLAGTVDAVLISHAHYDHLHMDTLLRVPAIGMTAIPQGSEKYFTPEEAAHAHPQPVHVGEVLRVGSLEIVPVPAAHNGSRFHPLRSARLAVGYIIRSPNTTLYYAGDTAAHNDFASIRDHYHPDVAILPIGAYAPRFPLRHHHLNPEEAVAAAQRLGVRRVVPCHFGTFTLSFDRPTAALPRFAAAARRTQVSWTMPAFAREPDLVRAPPPRVAGKAPGDGA